MDLKFYFLEVRTSCHCIVDLGMVDLCHLDGFRCWRLDYFTLPSDDTIAESVPLTVHRSLAKPNNILFTRELPRVTGRSASRRLQPARFVDLTLLPS